jgi:hypothetical protein
MFLCTQRVSTRYLVANIDGNDAMTVEERFYDHINRGDTGHRCRLDSLGVTHSGVQDIQDRGGPLIVLRDPDNIQVELTAGWQLSQRI